MKFVVHRIVLCVEVCLKNRLNLCIGMHFRNVCGMDQIMGFTERNEKSRTPWALLVFEFTARRGDAIFMANCFDIGGSFSIVSDVKMAPGNPFGASEKRIRKSLRHCGPCPHPAGYS